MAGRETGLLYEWLEPREITMKIRITAGGIYGLGGVEVPIGTEYDLKEEPKGWAGRYEVIEEKPSDDAKVVTNPKRGNKDAIGSADE